MATHDHIAQARSVPIESVLAARGYQLRRCGGELVGPCPVCGGHDRFAVNPKKSVWNCRGCAEGGDVIDLVRHLDRCNFSNAIERLSAGFDPVQHAKAQAEDADHQRRQHEKAAWLWSRRQPIKGTLAEKYLQARGITCPLPQTLGFLPPRGPEQNPAMIGAFGLPDESEPGVLGEPPSVRAVHLTLLKPDGSGKAEVEHPKRFLGSPGNLPIVLAPPNDLLGMAITEGIEDALTVHQALGLGAWAAGSAGRMSALADTLPGYIEAVTICAHPDRPAGPARLRLPMRFSGAASKYSSKAFSHDNRD